MLSNYPDGLSDYSVGAPWNEPGVPEKDFEITCSQSLSRTATVCTNNYIPGASGVDYEPDDEGGYCACGWHDPDDTSDTDWSKEYDECGYMTPLQLIQLFKTHLEKELSSKELTQGKINWYKHLIEECGCWSDDETEYIVEN